MLSEGGGVAGGKAGTSSYGLMDSRPPQALIQPGQTPFPPDKTLMNKALTFSPWW